MSKKDKRATDELNVALAGISSALSVAKTFLGEGHAALSVLEKGQEYCDEARNALITIQFYAAKI